MYSSALNCLSNLLKNEGFFALYKGDSNILNIKISILKWYIEK